MKESQAAALATFGYEAHGCKYAVGDRLVFGKYAGQRYEIAGEKFIILQEQEILGKVLPAE